MTIYTKLRDSWENLLTGAGVVGRDKTRSTLPTFVPLAHQELETLFHTDWLAYRIVTAIVDDALRLGWSLDAGDATDVISDRLEALNALSEIQQAATWARTFGGAILLIGVDDGQKMSEPVDVARVRGIASVRHVHPPYVRPYSWDEHGNVGQYWVAVAGESGELVHADRVVAFRGALASDDIRRQLGGWDLSVLQRPYDVLQAHAGAWNALGSLVADASQGVFKIRGLIDAIANGQKQAVLERFALVDIARSSGRSLVVDAEGEDFARTSTTFTGVPETMDRYQQLVSGASQIPVSILFGRSAAGENATGENDFRAWYGAVDVYRGQQIAPAVQRLALLLGAEYATVSFPALWTPSDAEKAATRKTIAETDAIYLANGVLEPAEIALTRFRPEGFSTETDMSDSMREIRESELATGSFGDASV